MTFPDRARPDRDRPGPNPVLAALLSLVFPGAGHLYAGDRERGWRFIKITLLAVVPLLILLAFVVLFTDVGGKIGLIAPFFEKPWLVITLLIPNALLLVFRAFTVVDSYYVAARTGTHDARMTAVLGIGLAFLLLLTLFPHGYAGQRILVSYEGLTVDLSRDIRSEDAANAIASDPSATTIAPPSSVATTESTATTAPAGPDPFAALDRVNVLLLGGDAGVGRESVRTDTMIVVSIDPETGYTAMFSVPRNNINMLFPESLPAYNAYDCNCYPALLNLLYAWAFSHEDLFPGESNPGGVAMKETIGYLLGIDIQYFAKVDMAGFIEIIDALGGVTINVTEAIHETNASQGVDGELVVDIPVGIQTMDGRTALVYSRSRRQSDDYNRMGRQRCLLEALAKQADPVTLINELPTILPALTDALVTDIPSSDFPEFLGLLQTADLEEIVSIRFIFDAPEFAGTSTSYVAEWIGDGYPYPDYDLIQQTVATALSLPPADAIAALNLQTTEESCG